MPYRLGGANAMPTPRAWPRRPAPPAPPLLLPSAAHTPARTPRRRPLGAHVTATPVGTGRERRVTPGRRPCASAGCSRTSAAAHLFSNEPA
ncbi:hypothetical protein MRX96_042353 [Rhipicephalus microplus]